MQGIIEPGLHPRSRLIEEVLTEIGANIGLQHAAEQELSDRIQALVQRHEDIQDIIRDMEGVQETLRVFADMTTEVDRAAGSTGEPEPEAGADGDRGR